MDIPSLIHTYGYWAVAGGTLMEGESILLAAGAAASRGYLKMPAVLVIATFCGFLSDQVFFYVGRFWGRKLMARFSKLQAQAARVNGMLERHDVPVILGVRFLYGLRAAGPIVIGMSAVPWWRFLGLNLLGAAIWACLIGGAGYALGHGVKRLIPVLHGIDADEVWLVGLLIVLALFWGIGVLLRRRAQAKRAHRCDATTDAP